MSWRIELLIRPLGAGGSGILELPGNALSLYCLSRVMSDPKELRARATRLFALALAAREQGMDAYANEVTKLASDALAEAEEIEQHDAD